MFILICLLIVVLIAVVLGMESEIESHQAQELIPIEIPVNEVAFSHTKRNRS